MARPAEFERNDVLNKAMDVFWRTGYTGTSITDLVQATNLKPGSLYGAFKSKRDLFIEVIDTYSQRRVRNIREALACYEHPIEAIHSFFDHFVEDLKKDEIGRGCLMVNTMLELATEDSEIRERITHYLHDAEAAFAEVLTKAQQIGEMPVEQCPSATAKYLMANIWGMRVLSSTRPDPESYQQIVRNTLTILPARR